jgi:hypothetical protein
MKLPADLLGDLVRGDSSEQVRWMALNAFSSDDVAVKSLAQAALADTSESVREKAKDILAGLNAAGQRPDRAQP